MNKIISQTPNLTEQKIAKIAQLFPHVITEKEGKDGKVDKAVDFDLLKQELSNELVEDDNERYRLDWPGKKASLLKTNTPINKTLRPVKEDSVNFDTTENLYIEGDNFEALKILQESYLGKVKMIYIDPPYNTGKDFVYKDNYKVSKDEYEEEIGVEDEEGAKLFKNTDTNGRFHSDWLSMMYERLIIARDLLKEDGVVFISIDDNEVHNLRKICDEIYGEENFIGTISVENNPKGRKNSEFISVSSEYLMIFAKNKQKAHFIENVPKKASDMKEDENGNFVHNSGKRVLVGENSFNKPVTNPNSDKNYSVYYRKSDKSFFLIKEEFATLNHKLLSEGYVKYYSYNNNHLIENTYTEKKFRELFNNGGLEFSQDKIYEKNLSDTIRIKSQLVNRKYEAVVSGKKQIYSMELTTTGAGTYMKNLFQMSELPFSAPKNVGYLKLLISLFVSEPFIVLDFFSGSSTTADAVMQLNAEDEGNRKFIMVQLSEKTDEDSEAYKAGYQTITEIGKERIRRAGKKILSELEEKNKQLKLGEDPVDASKLDIGFRVYKVDSTNMQDVARHPSELTQQSMFDEAKPGAKQESLLDFVDNIKSDRTPEDLLTETILNLGLELSLPIEEKQINGHKVFFVQQNSLIACFDENIDFSIIDEIAKLKPLKVVFRDSSFKDDKDRINLETRFQRLSPETTISVL